MKRALFLVLCLLAWAHPSFAAYTYYRAITLEQEQVPSTQSNFTVLVCANGTAPCDASVPGLNQSGGGAHVTQADGDDIVFGTNTTCSSLLTWQIDKYVAATGELIAKVLVSSLDGSTDTTIYMCYGDSGVTTFQGGAVGAAFDANVEAFYHLGDGSSLVLTDSSGNGLTLTNNNTATATTGKIGGGVAVAAASSQYLSRASFPGFTAITLSAWVNAASFPDYATVYGRSNAGGNTRLSIYTRGTPFAGKLASYSNASGGGWSFDASGSGAISTGTWALIHLTYSNANGAKAYINCTADATAASNGALETSAADLYIGYDAAASGVYFDGALDELTISSVERSADWITTECNNQSAPGSFVTFGAEQSTGGGGSGVGGMQLMGAGR